MIGIYCFAILYFIYITAFYFRPEQSIGVHTARIGIALGLIAYYVYQISQLIKKNKSIQ